MNDLLYLGLTLLFFALTYGFIVICERPDGGQDHERIVFDHRHHYA